MHFLPEAFRPGGREPIRSVEDGMSGSTLLQPPVGIARRPTVIAIDDKLATFRHMVGIHSTRSLSTPGLPPDVHHNNLHFDGRAAPNLGIYNRVVHREQEAKRGYKIASVLINGCLGVQVIVAASLTAMGAAGSNHIGVTAFGAINTVIAGVLTYLKGSGLPNRIRYYENEWKKVREFIEQRERDFSRPDCTLDVHEAVEVIEKMYEEVKLDIQTNTPDSYVSIGDLRNRGGATNPQVPKLWQSGDAHGKHGNKLRDLELKYGPRLTEFLESLAHKEEERLQSLEKGLAKDLETKASKAVDWEKDLEGRGRDFEKDLESRGLGFEKDIEGRGRNLEKDVEGMERGIQHNVEAKGQDINRDLGTQARNIELKVSHVADLGRDLAAQGSRIMNFGRDAEKEAERRGENLRKIGREIDDEIHAQGPKGEK